MGREYNSETPALGWDPLHHRDIKPSDIFLDKPIAQYRGYPNPVLADFDAAEPFEPEDKTEGGTELFRAPETNSPKAYGEPDTRSDIWSLGMVTWELINANRRQKTFKQLRVAAIKRLEPKFEFEDPFESYDRVGASYTSHLLGLIKGCLKIDPDERPTIPELRAQTERELKRIQNICGSIKGEQVEERQNVRGIGLDRFPLRWKYQGMKRKREGADDDMGEEAGKMDRERALKRW
ncbi:kinase-like protein [Lojkania enalia]|uniref:non-specific serine/threonine protein kinase n=1 Tax=Lojkania enalia TaxID=147567 RepID=A0A9P4K314_9PLEO|nr:kinase-like protein [Didymosphaeria enalia]